MTLGTFALGTQPLAGGTAAGISGVSPTEFFWDNTDVDILSAISIFGATQGTGTVYLSDADTLAGSVNEVEIAGAVNTWAADVVNLDFSGLSDTERSNLATLGPGTRYLIVVTNAGDEYGSPALITHRPIAFQMFATANFTDGDPTTEQLTSPGGTFEAGGRYETDGTTDAKDRATGVHTEDEFSMRAVDGKAVEGRTYHFRLVLANGTVFDSYDVVPAVITSGIPTATPADLAHAHTLDSPAVTAAANVAPADLADGSTLDSPAVTAVATVVPDDLSHGSTLDSPTVSTDTSVTPDDLSHAHALDSPTVTTITTVVPTDLSHAHELGSPTVTSGSVAAPDDLAHGSTLNSPTVSAFADVTPDGLSHSHTLDSPVVLSGVTAAPDDLAHASTLDSPSVTANVTVTPSDLEHASTLDSPTITVSTTVTPADLSHSHTLDEPVVIPDGFVAPDELSHSHTLGSPTLIAEIIGTVDVTLGDFISDTLGILTPAARVDPNLTEHRLVIPPVPPMEDRPARRYLEISRTIGQDVFNRLAADLERLRRNTEDIAGTAGAAYHNTTLIDVGVIQPGATQQLAWSWPGTVNPSAVDAFPATYIPESSGTITRAVLLVQTADPTLSLTVQFSIGGSLQPAMVLPAAATSAEFTGADFTSAVIASNSTKIYPVLGAEASGAAVDLSILLFYTPA